MFARQLPDERFEAFLSFVQSLTEAAALVPHALIIGFLPGERRGGGRCERQGSRWRKLSSTRMEANPSRRISQLRAATRAARAVFLCSAPLVGRPNAGLTGLGLRLACAEPGDQLAIFGEALRELTEGATYLYEEAGRYWFSTQPTLNRLADDRAKAIPDHEVEVAIAEVLRDDSAHKGGFHRVFAVPDDPITIDEARALSLVILGPSSPHAGRAPPSRPPPTPSLKPSCVAAQHNAGSVTRCSSRWQTRHCWGAPARPCAGPWRGRRSSMIGDCKSS